MRAAKKHFKLRSHSLCAPACKHHVCLFYCCQIVATVTTETKRENMQTNIKVAVHHPDLRIRTAALKKKTRLKRQQPTR